MANAKDFEQFTVLSTSEGKHNVFGDYTEHCSARERSTPVALSASIRAHHPDLSLTITSPYTCDLLGFAASGHAQLELDQSDDFRLLIRGYQPPPTRLDGAEGVLTSKSLFTRYRYQWSNHNFIIYIIEGYRDGAYMSAYLFILHKPEGEETVRSPSAVADKLVLAASKWSLKLHNEVWMFDGYWQKSRTLWESARKASWDDVILDQKMKEAVIDDVEGFYDERDAYKKFAVPWKRGILFYGPPGNGKTISIKAIMKSLSDRKDSVPTLYVKTFQTYGGPQRGIREIFLKARATAPCFLVFEDLDSLVNGGVRSYFLNEVDGLESNEGILMLGSTNHLELLDPGIAKRPSRFDRKYLYPLPNKAERVQYCEYWRQKLKENPELEFPKRLCAKIAAITDDFSFAYMKEAFIATLMALVARRSRLGNELDVAVDDDHDDLDDLPLWKEIKKQIQILRDEMESERPELQPTQQQPTQHQQLQQQQQVMSITGAGQDLEWWRNEQSDGREQPG